VQRPNDYSRYTARGLRRRQTLRIHAVAACATAMRGRIVKSRDASAWCYGKPQVATVVRYDTGLGAGGREDGQVSAAASER
jgi:hypothetical protein